MLGRGHACSAALWGNVQRYLAGSVQDIVTTGLKTSRALHVGASLQKQNISDKEDLLASVKENETQAGETSRTLSSENNSRIPGTLSGTTTISAAASTKFQVFRDEDATVILDVEEERRKNMEWSNAELEKETEEEEFSGISLQRGNQGVFEVEELVDILQADNAVDIFVAEVPREYKYVDHIVVASGRSERHMRALAEFVRKVFKRKRNPEDIIPKIEGITSKDWVAMDLGNIALHVFSKKSRRVYDLESLWSVGVQYDALCHAPEDPLVALLELHTTYLSDLKPQKADVSTPS